MKKFLLLPALCIFFFAASAQNEKYVSAMTKNIVMLDSAFRSTDAFLGLANTFERIATAEKSQWLPYYYAAYSHLNYGFMQKDPKGNDPIADKAEALINKADSLQPGNSEISCIKSMIASARLMVNPMQRYMEYGRIGDDMIKKAKEQDPANPRPYMLKGQGLKYTPEQYGGGCKTAKPELEKAMEKFNAFKPATDLSPNWGKAYTELMVIDCANTN